MKWIIEDQYEGMLLRTYLQNVAHLSDRLIKRAKRGEILINGVLKTVRYTVRTGDILEIKLSVKKSALMKPEKLPLHILYEDDDILVVNKAAGIPTIPSQLYPSGTLANSILHHYKENDINATVHVVTRLDKDTSGIVLIAKHPYSHSLLSDLQRANEIERTYVAVVAGILQEEKAVIDAPIGRKAGSMIERIVTQSGKRAITHYEVLQQFTTYALVKVKLVTGRTHQIRVHFSYIGHPLLGDDLYGGATDLINRQTLHCHQLTFNHPIHKQQMTYEAPFPSDMKMLL